MKSKEKSKEKKSPKRIILFFVLLTFLFSSNTLISKESKAEKDLLLTKLKMAKDIEKSAILNKLAKAYWWDKDKNLVLNYGKDALKYAKKFRQEKERVYALISLSHANRRIEKLKLAKKFSKKALKLAKKRKNSKEILDVLITFERIYDFYDFKKNIKKNYRMTKQIVHYADKANERRTLAMYTHALAGLTYRLGDEKKAFEIYKKCLNLYKENKNLSFQAHILTYIGGFYRKWKNFKKALYYMNEAKNIAFKSNNKKKICRVYNGFGRIYFEQKEYKIALEYFEKGLILANEINDTRWKANFNLYTGQCLVKLKRYKIAIEKFLLKGLKVIKSNKYYEDSDFNESLYLEISNAYMGLNELEKTYHYLINSLVYSVKNEDYETLLLTYQNLGIYFEKINNNIRSEYFYKKGLKIINRVRENDLKKEYYKIVSDFFLRIKKKKLFKKYKKKYLENI